MKNHKNKQLDNANSRALQPPDSLENSKPTFELVLAIKNNQGKQTGYTKSFTFDNGYDMAVTWNQHQPLVKRRKKDGVGSNATVVTTDNAAVITTDTNNDDVGVESCEAEESGTSGELVDLKNE